MRHGGREGFTLLELLIALAIIALAGLAAVPALESARRAGELRRDSANIAAQLREARGRAIATRKQVAVAFDVAARTYGISGQRPFKLSERARLELAAAAQLSQGDRTGVILFFPVGSSSGGRITLVQGDDRRTIAIDWLLGQIKEAS